LRRQSLFFCIHFNSWAPNDDYSHCTIWWSGKQRMTEVVAQNVSIIAHSCTVLSWHIVLWYINLSVRVLFMRMSCPLSPWI
jgi:hypothetical protein